jgi:hypothetical protein
MEYQATFEIKCGVYSSNTPLEQFQKTETFSADNVNFAGQKVRVRAKKLAHNYLSTPDNGSTRVNLVSLKDAQGEIVFSPPRNLAHESSMVRLLAMSM